jgi:hypothetical protein
MTNFAWIDIRRRKRRSHELPNTVFQIRMPRSNLLARRDGLGAAAEPVRRRRRPGQISGLTRAHLVDELIQQGVYGPMASVLITSASRGLGLEFAAQYLADGWQVYAACRHPEAAEKLQRLARDEKERIDILVMDVTNSS